MIFLPLMALEISLMLNVYSHLPNYGFLQLVLTSVLLADLFLPISMIV